MDEDDELTKTPREHQSSFTLDNTLQAAHSLQRLFLKEHLVLLEQSGCSANETPRQLAQTYQRVLQRRLQELDALIETRRETAQQLNAEKRLVSELAVLSEQTQLQRLRHMLWEEHQALTLSEWRQRLYKENGIAVDSDNNPVSPLLRPPQPLSVVMPNSKEAETEMQMAENGAQSFCQFHALRLLSLHQQQQDDAWMSKTVCALAVLQQQLSEMQSPESHSPLVLSDAHCEQQYTRLGWTEERARRLHKTLLKMKHQVDLPEKQTLSVPETRELLILALHQDEDVVFFRPLWQALLKLAAVGLQDYTARLLQTRHVIVTIDLLQRQFEKKVLKMGSHDTPLAVELAAHQTRAQIFSYKTLQELDQRLDNLLVDWARGLLQVDNVGLRLSSLIVALSVTLQSRERVASAATAYFDKHSEKPSKADIRDLILQHTEFY
jgi:hypothetical protein